MERIKMNFIETGWGVVDWTGKAEDGDKWRALVNVVMNIWALLNAGKLSSSYTSD
jgi:hypothetical protein